ncbi:MAG TPA: putative porin [Candidatus Limnocylindria bacterium]|nr:putative porin [Candidatus Limnocylindria bacterium]
MAKSNHTTLPRLVLLAALWGSASGLQSLHAQSADALIDKLVEKGILNVDEANGLREETDKDFAKSFSAKTGMPDWVTAFKINGDFRGRFEHFNSDNDLFTSRTRYRYRVRLGFTVVMADDFEVGLRLASADAASGFTAGNPLSANTTFQDGATRKGVYFDTAYAKWTPIHNGVWAAGVTVGKMDSQFQVSNMVFDADYQPEGAQAFVSYQLNEKNSFKAIGGFFALDELNQIDRGAAPVGPNAPSHDPFLTGGQLVWEAKWTPKLESMFGLGVFSLNNKDNLYIPQTGNPIVPLVNDGNTRIASKGAYQLAYNYNPIVADGAIVYKLDSFPLYNGAFPIKFMGEYMNNPGAPSNNTGYRAGVTFGKAGEKGHWEISYRYQCLEADAWYDELVDDDNGAFYQTAATFSGYYNAVTGGPGWRGGTNIKGHFVQFQYSVTDSLTFVFSYYLNTLVQPNPVGSTSAAGHFMADLTWKF